MARLQESEQLQIVQLPSMKVLYATKTSQSVFLVQHQGNWAANKGEAHDMNLFVEQKNDALLIRSMSKADPRYLLNLLVRKAKFNEAETYAADLGLDLEVSALFH